MTSLSFPLISGPKEPKNFVACTPDKEMGKVKRSLFQEDTSPISESSDEGDSTLSYAKKITTKKFTFRKFQHKKAKIDSPTSSPLHWPEPVVISSDEELEKSMIEEERKVSLEMSDTD